MLNMSFLLSLLPCLLISTSSASFTFYPQTGIFLVRHPYSFAFNPDGSELVTQRIGNGASRYSTQTGDPVSPPFEVFDDDYFLTIDWSLDGELITGQDYYGNVVVWDAVDGINVANISAPVDNKYVKVTFDRENPPRWLAIGRKIKAQDSVVMDLVDLQQSGFEIDRTLTPPTSTSIVRDFSFSPGGRYMVVVRTPLTLYDFHLDMWIESSNQDINVVVGAEWTSDGSTLLVGSGRDLLKLNVPDIDNPVQSLPNVEGLRAYIDGIVIDPTDSYVAIGCGGSGCAPEKIIRLFDLDTLTEIAGFSGTISADGNPLQIFKFSPASTRAQPVVGVRGREMLEIFVTNSSAAPTMSPHVIK